MRPITEGLPSKRKRIPTKWQKPIRPSPITGGKVNPVRNSSGALNPAGILENWNTGMVGSNEKKINFFNIPIFHHSIRADIRIGVYKSVKYSVFTKRTNTKHWHYGPH
jgi:hypothetical protein